MDILKALWDRVDILDQLSVSQVMKLHGWQIPRRAHFNERRRARTVQISPKCDHIEFVSEIWILVGLRDSNVLVHPLNEEMNNLQGVVGRRETQQIQS